ncbi:MAG: MMPL family transporter [Pseudomonadales bacterium]|nr:MMPL family transporter [Pseudomonadales bacterium]
MIEQISSRLIEYRKLFFALSILSLFLALAGFQNFKFDGSARGFFKEDYGPYMALEALEEKYGKESRAFIMLETQQADVFNRADLALFEQMTLDAELLPYIVRVESITNFSHTYSEDDDMYVENLVEQADSLSDQQLAKIKQVALSDISLVNRLVSPNGKYVALSLEFNIGKENQQEKEFELVEQIYQWVDELESANPDINIYVTGDIVSTYNNAWIVIHDVSIMIPSMFALMFVVLGVIMRTVAGVMTAVLISFVAMLTGMGLGAWFGITFTMMTMNAVMIIITVTIAHCIHILNHFFHAYREPAASKQQALLESLHINYIPVTLTSLTTALGFLTLNTSDLPPTAGLGNVSALGVLASWTFSLTMLPALVMWLPIKKPVYSESKLENLMQFLASWVIKRRNMLLLSTMICAIGMGYAAAQNQINDRFSDAIKKPHKFRTHNEKIDQHFGGLYNYHYELPAKGENGITDIEYLQKVEAFTEWLRQQPEIKGVYSFVDVIKRLNKSMHGDDPAYYRLPESSELAAQYLLLYELSLPPGVDLNNQVLLDKSATRVSTTTAAADTNKIFEMQQRVNDWQAANLPAYMRKEGASMAVMWSKLSYDSFVKTLQGSFIALIAISFIMILVLKSFRYGFISLVPNVIPAVMGFGFWALYDGELTMGLTSVVIITMGIVVDDTVHFLSKYKFAKDNLQANTEQAIRYSFKYVGTALWTTTFVLVAGFSLLVLSKAVSNVELGILTSSIIFSALLLDFFLLPPLLLLLDKHKKASV